MKNKVSGFGFRLTGLILGIVAAVVAVVGIVFSCIGMNRARLCKHCKMEGMYQ